MHYKNIKLYYVRGQGLNIETHNWSVAEVLKRATDLDVSVFGSFSVSLMVVIFMFGIIFLPLLASPTQSGCGRRWTKTRGVVQGKTFGHRRGGVATTLIQQHFL